jgi:hypothetical protein
MTDTLDRILGPIRPCLQLRNNPANGRWYIAVISPEVPELPLQNELGTGALDFESFSEAHDYKMRIG